MSMYKKSIKGRNSQEIGIYVVCDNNQIMREINHMLRRRGMISITDTAGHMHYMIDARTNPALAGERLKEIIDTGILYDGTDSDSLLTVSKLASLIIDEYDFDWMLIGTNMLYETIVRGVISDIGPNGNFKEIYLELASRYGVSTEQVQRNIRYAVRQSALGDSDGKCRQIISYLLGELLLRVEEVSDNQELIRNASQTD